MAFFVIMLAWPESTISVMFLFYPKVIGICVLAVLLSRVKMRQEQLNSNIQSKSLHSSLKSRAKSNGGDGTSAGVSGFTTLPARVGGQPMTDEYASEANLINSERT